ncbi:zinc finger, CCHC-type containing protein [Tanacetum coccineum]|uniref:Zinc finger, CCHC-type containing protein n=1 Tax=Tanacetum coccineum TaxID=301880 RepID=A0ABQ5IAM3_9ASTR
MLATPFEKIKLAGYALAAMVPSMRIKSFLSKEIQVVLQPDENIHLYKKWIDNIASQKFEIVCIPFGSASQIEELLNKLTFLFDCEDLQLWKPLSQCQVSTPYLEEYVEEWRLSRDLAVSRLIIPTGTKDEVSDQHSYCFNVEDDPKAFDEVIKLQMDLQKKTQVAHISTIRLLIAMASIHNLIIHQMDVKTTFLNGELDEDVYMNQPQGFIMLGNENKVCKLIKSLYGLKHAPKQWHQKFDEVILSNGYLLNQADKWGVDMTKEFLSSKFSMKDMEEANVILGIRIKHESNGIAISRSHYIKKILKKFNYFDCTPVSTPTDTSEKLMPNNGQAVSQLEYSKVIGCMMYAMTCTRPAIAFLVGKQSRHTSNLGTQHWQAIQRVLKYLKKTMDYSLTCIGYPSMLEGYTDASWISNTEDNSSTSG